MKETYGFHRCNLDPENPSLPKEWILEPPTKKEQNRWLNKNWRTRRVDSGTKCEFCGTISRFVEP